MSARHAKQIVEFDINWCSLIHNRAPCLGALEGDFVPLYSYVFENGDELGWNVNNDFGDFVAGATEATWTQTGADPKWRSPQPLTFDGSVDYLIRLDIERTADRSSGAWQGSIYFVTSSGGGGGHGESGSFTKTFPADLLLGERQLLVFDMSSLTVGTTNWITSVIEQVRFDFDTAGSGAFKIYSIQIGHYASADEATGTARCFNTKATCQSAAQFSASTVTLRFAEPSALPDLSIEAIRSIAGVSFTPAKINPGEDLGERAQLRVTLKDHPHSDTGDGFDKYHATRSYNPFEQGTLWGKFRARQPYLRGAAIRWYLGYDDQELSEMECRSFIVESFDGPTVDGTYTLIAVDPLKMLDGDRAQAPAVSNGRLVAGINTAVTSATLTPAGIGNSEYAASGHLAISGSESVSFTRAADVLTIVRAQLNSEAVAHDAADRVQTILRYVSMDPADIIYDLMVTYAGVPASYIPLADWQAETAAYLRREYTASIAEPTPVAELVAELMQQCGLALWWDDIGGKIRLRVLRALTPSTTLVFDNTNVSNGTFSRKEQPNKRWSQVWTFFGQKNPLAGQEENDNYRQVIATPDLVREENYGPGLRKLYSRWIAAGALTAAERINDLILSRYGDPPRYFTFTVMRDAQENPQLGNVYSLTWITEQLPDGSPETVVGQVVRLTPLKDRFVVELEEAKFGSLTAEDLSNRSITVNYDALDLNIRSMHDEQYPDPTDGITVNFLVDTNTWVGASLTSIPALQTGSWPTKAVTGLRTSGSPILTGIADTTGLAVGQFVTGTGIPAQAKILSIVPNTSITLDANASSGAGTSTALTVYTVILNVTVRGNVAGRGAKGGRGANGNGNSSGQAGAVGGKALKVDYPINLTDEDGMIAGGGGGGGGGPCRDPSDHRGGGGGGGQGELGGDGGEGPGNGREGQPGSRTAAGAGGHGWTNNNFFQGPSDDSTRRGGNGGLFGQSGQSGQGSSDVPGGAAGAAGAAIDGVSKVKTIGPAGDRRGSQIN